MIFRTVSTFEVIAEQYLQDVFNSKSFTELGFSLRPDNNASCMFSRQYLSWGKILAGSWQQSIYKVCFFCRIPGVADWQRSQRCCQAQGFLRRSTNRQVTRAASTRFKGTVAWDMFYGQVTGDQLEESVITYEIENNLRRVSLILNVRVLGKIEITNQEAEILRYCPFKNWSTMHHAVNTK